MEGLQICSSSVGIMSVGNVSKNMNNERNKVNYTKELKQKDHGVAIKKNGTTLGHELKVLCRKNDSGP